MAEVSSYVALRYMTRFRCIGGECEDPCCREWDVPVDQAHLDALREAMGGSEAERAEFAAALRPHRDDERRAVALMVQRPDRSCVMLGGDGLCSIQRRYGEALLPDGCAVYPRSVGQVKDRVELSASLSCPEAARLCLLHEDSAALIPVDPSLIARGQIHRRIGAPRSLGEAAFDDVREQLRALAADGRYPLRSRLFFLATFLDRASPLLGPGAGPRQGVQLQGLLQLLSQDPVREQLHRQISAAQLDEPFAVTVVTQLLTVAQPRAMGAFRALLSSALGTYEAEPGAGVSRQADGAFAFDPVALDAAYRRRRTLPPPLAAREDEVLERYCLSHFIRDWYLKAPSLRAYGMGLLVRLATIRFLLRSHPALRAEAPDDAARLRAFDAAAVQVVYTLSRTLDHDEALLRAVLESMAEQRMDTLPHAVCLLSF